MGGAPAEPAPAAGAACAGSVTALQRLTGRAGERGAGNAAAAGSRTSVLSDPGRHHRRPAELAVRLAPYPAVSPVTRWRSRCGWTPCTSSTSAATASTWAGADDAGLRLPLVSYRLPTQSDGDDAPRGMAPCRRNASRPAVIERILRDRRSIWQQIVEERDLNRLTGQMLASSAIALACYGAVLGFFHSPLMALTSAVKLPLLFLVTLAICLPTLYLFNLVFGARLSMRQSLSLVMVAITVTAMLAVAFAPISLFFLITAPDYGFFKLLNVAILALSALVGLRFLTGGMQVLNDHGLLAPEAAKATVDERQRPARQACRPRCLPGRRRLPRRSPARAPSRSPCRPEPRRPSRPRTAP